MEVTSLVIDGSPKKERYLVIVNGEKCWIQGRLFMYLTKLVKARLTSEGWIEKYDIEPGANQARYLYRLRQQLEEAGFELKIENSKTGLYRLTVTDVSLNPSTLQEHPDHQVRAMVC